MRWLAVIALLLAWPASAQYAPFILAAESGELFDAPTLNINTSYDPLCDPDTFAAAGGLFCEGFEDGSLGDRITLPSTATDGWRIQSSNGDGCAPNGSTGCDDDPLGNDFTNCNSNVTDTGKADFGAAGTPCTATNLWGQLIEPAHCIMVDGSGDQAECNTNHTLDLQDIRARFYFKLSGESSTRCPSGYPNCSTFSWSTTNGVKGVEWRDGLDTGGITAPNWSLENSNNTSWVIGIGDPNTCIVGTSSSNASQTCTSGSTGPGAYCRQNVGSFNWQNHLDEWIFVEMHIAQSDTPESSTVEMWMNACGADGLGCDPDTTSPTKTHESFDLNMLFNGSGCSLPDAFYWNFNHNGTQIGEVQFDEIIIMDGAVRTTPIGFMNPLE